MTCINLLSAFAVVCCLFIFPRGFPANRLRFLLAPPGTLLLSDVFCSLAPHAGSQTWTPTPGSGHSYIQDLDETLNPANRPGVRTARLLLVFLTALIAVGGATTTTVLGQTSSIASSTLPARDQAALASLQAGVDATGTDLFWGQVHATLVVGTSRSKPSDPSTLFTWTDEWHGVARMRRESISTAGLSRLAFVQSDSAIDRIGTIATPTISKPPLFHQPRFDKATSLLIHLPSAAFYAILHDTSYGVTSAAISPDDPNSNCVRVTKGHPISDDSVDLTICISASTKLPTRAVFKVHDLLHSSRLLSETVEYRSFYQAGQGLVPKDVVVTDPVSNVKLLSFTSATWNPPLAIDMFSGVSR